MRFTASELIRVHRNSRGRWEVAVPGAEEVSCPTLHDAREAAYRAAEGMRPCTLIVRDAYHRVLEREVIRS